MEYALVKVHFSVIVRLVLCLNILLIVDGVKQNPGPQKYPPRASYVSNVKSEGYDSVYIRGKRFCRFMISIYINKKTMS